MNKFEQQLINVIFIKLYALIFYEIDDNEILILCIVILIIHELEVYYLSLYVNIHKISPSFYNIFPLDISINLTTTLPLFF